MKAKPIPTLSRYITISNPDPFGNLFIVYDTVLEQPCLNEDYNDQSQAIYRANYLNKRYNQYRTGAFQ